MYQASVKGLAHAIDQLNLQHGRQSVRHVGPQPFAQPMSPPGTGTKLALLRPDISFHTAGEWTWYEEYCLSEQQTGPNTFNIPTRKLVDGTPVPLFCWNPTDVTLLRSLGGSLNYVVVFKVCGDSIAAQEGKQRDLMVYPLPLEPCIEETPVSNI